VNISHPIKLTRLAIRKSLQRGKHASVCIIASGAGISGKIAALLYCVTKHAIIGFVKSMKDSEPLTSVKVTTICPGIVNMPMFTEEKHEQFSTVTDAVFSSNVVARYMLELFQEKRYQCGTMLEVRVGGTRELPEWNVSPPTGMDLGLDLDEVKMKMIGLIQEQLAKEKGSA
jgi:short-subunit dehydrogenase